MKVASDAWRFVIPLVVVSVVLCALEFCIAGAVAFGAALFVLFFFRDPHRDIPADPKAVTSPADGRIVRIDRDWYDEQTDEKRIRISIFLSIFNVHINRFPVAGKIIKKEMRDGKFLAAFNHMASEENAQSIMLIESDYGRITVKQIVGLIARRIVCHARQDDVAVKGDRFGLMRFGSRMDVTLPADAKVEVRLKDKVYGGSSVLAFLQS